MRRRPPWVKAWDAARAALSPKPRPNAAVPVACWPEDHPGQPDPSLSRLRRRDPTFLRPPRLGPAMFYQASWWTVAPGVRLAFRTRFEGREHVPKTGPAILASNHLSFLDHLILGASTRRQIYYISKMQHFDYPVRRFLFRRWGVIPLRRGEGDAVAFERSLEVLGRGDLFAIYPEGTRSLDGRLHKGHTGVARLHLLSGAPVVPVAMWGTFEAMPKGKRVPKFVKCGARFGAPLSFLKPEKDVEDRATLRRITDAIMHAIRDLSGQAYVDEYQFNPEVKTASGAREANGASRGRVRSAAKKK